MGVRVRALPALLGAVVLALLGVAAGPAAGATAPVDVLANGGFESGDLSGWACTGSSGGVVESPVRSGSYALAATPAGRDDAQCSQRVAVRPNSTYTVTAWVRGNYVYLGATGTGVSGTRTWGSSSRDWKELTTTFTTGTDTRHVTVYVHGWYGQPTFHVDDMSVTGPPPGGGGRRHPPDAPSGLTVTGTTSATVSLAWSGSNGATSYNVYSGDRRVATGITATSYTVTRLLPDTGYTFTVTAVDAAGESPHSGGVSATTEPGGGGGGNAQLPEHALVGYLHASFVNGSGYLPIADVSNSWDVIDLAFGVSAGGGTIEFHRCGKSECPGRESDAAFLAGIEAKQARGSKVLLSIGGANGEVTLDDAAERRAFVSSVESIIDRWHLDGVDLDFENQSLKLDRGDDDPTHPTTPAVVNLIEAVRALKAHYGSDFVLTMAPQTFFVQLGYSFYGGVDSGADPRAGAWLPVIYALRDDLTLLAVQDYNSGPIVGLDDQYHTMGGAGFPIAMTDMLTAGFPIHGTGKVFPPLDPGQIAIGLPANQEAGNGAITPAQIDRALDCLTKGTSCGGYTVRGGVNPDLRGLMTWSINWDHYAGGTFAGTFDSYFGG